MGPNHAHCWEAPGGGSNVQGPLNYPPLGDAAGQECPASNSASHTSPVCGEVPRTNHIGCVTMLSARKFSRLPSLEVDREESLLITCVVTDKT